MNNTSKNELHSVEAKHPATLVTAGEASFFPESETAGILTYNPGARSTPKPGAELRYRTVLGVDLLLVVTSRSVPARRIRRFRGFSLCPRVAVRVVGQEPTPAVAA